MDPGRGEDGRAATAGLGIVVEYAGASGPPRWQPPPPFAWDYTVFGGTAAPAEPDGRLTLAFRATRRRPPLDDQRQVVSEDRSDRRASRTSRYRWMLDNQSADPHPVHLHRHTFELVRFVGRPTSGCWKDVVVVPPWKQVEIDVPTTQPGLALFHCHQQFHMDMGFMTMMRYEP